MLTDELNKKNVFSLKKNFISLRGFYIDCHSVVLVTDSRHPLITSTSLATSTTSWRSLDLTTSTSLTTSTTS